MKIGINASFFSAGRGGGIERVVRRLAESLGGVAREHEFILFSCRGNANTFRLAGNFSERVIPADPENRFSKLMAEQAILPLLAATQKLDALISPGNFAPLFAPVPQVLILHDCVPWERSAKFGAFHGLALKALFLLSAARAGKIVVPSRFSRLEAIRRLGAGSGKVSVAPESGEHVPARHSGKNPAGGFILCVSSEAPHKNAIGLLGAYRIARLNFGVRLPLVITGLAERPGNPGVVFRKSVSEEILRALYQEASLAVVPSFYEGFGLAAAEAMRAGVPLAASNISALRETAGGAALYFDPRNKLEMARAVFSISNDPTLWRRLSRAGQKRAEGLKWDDFAGRVMEAVKSCAGKPAA